MISNEHGLIFVEMPFSGYELFKERMLESNRDTSFEDEFLPKCIEYQYSCIVRNPYLRAVCLYKNGCKLREEHDLKPQNFTNYFENTLNLWDFVEGDEHKSQFSYLEKTVDDLMVFRCEDLVDNWGYMNEFLADFGLKSIKYFIESKETKNWEQYYEDQTAIELIEYLFDDDFSEFNYSKL